MCRRLSPIHWPPSNCTSFRPMRVTPYLTQRTIERGKRMSFFALMQCPQILSSGRESYLTVRCIQKAKSPPYLLCKSYNRTLIWRIPRMIVISSSPSHSPSHGGNTESSLPCSVAALSTPFIESLASPFFPKNLEPAYPPVGRDFNLYDTFAIPPASQWLEARQRGPAGTCDENINANLRNVLDPTTIFVGGLEVHGRCSWDEQRLRQVFGQYGEITEVKLVRPGAWIRLMMRSDAYFHISQPTGSQRSLL